MGSPILYFVLVSAYGDYWLTKDGSRVIGVVTADRLNHHSMIDYTYTAENKEYTGSSVRDWNNKEYTDLRIGRPVPLYYSASHPSISTAIPPRFAILEYLFWSLIIPFVILIVMLFSGLRHKTRFQRQTSEPRDDWRPRDYSSAMQEGTWQLDKPNLLCNHCKASQGGKGFADMARRAL